MAVLKSGHFFKYRVICSYRFPKGVGAIPSFAFPLKKIRHPDIAKALVVE